MANPSEYVPPQYPYAPGNGPIQPPSVTIVQQPPIVNPYFPQPMRGKIESKSSVQMTCPNCRSLMNTIVQVRVDGLAWLTCALCCLLGCWCGCCILPFFVDSFRDRNHICPVCRIVVG